MKHVSFDFDGTLEFPEVQAYAAELMKREDVTVWVTTRRFSNKLGRKNLDLYKVTKKLGIPNERITFCNLLYKFEIISNKPFIWHLDDDPEDLNALSKGSNGRIKCIQFMSGGKWAGWCEKFLNQ